MSLINLGFKYFIVANLRPRRRGPGVALSGLSLLLGLSLDLG